MSNVLEEGVLCMGMAASHASGKKANDRIFIYNTKAQADAKKIGKENVVNGTLGAIYDENGDILFLKAVEEEYLHLPRQEYAAYAPIAGLPEFLEAAIDECLDGCKPDAYISAVATAGGTGCIHHLVHNYTNPGDKVLTADWHWGAYEQICRDNHRELVTYSLFTDEFTFNIDAFKQAMLDLAKQQENILVIINTPGHNPTGFSLTDEDWQQVVNFTKELVAKGKNKVIIGVDVAYIDYSGPKTDVRKFFRLFSQLPKEILVVACYSISKSFTMYGQRVGALISMTSDKEVDEEFKEINTLTSRATWSNICRPAMRTVADIVENPAKMADYEAERMKYGQLIEERAHIFMEEAEACELTCLPYCGGFFITIPTEQAIEACEELMKKHIYIIPLAHGLRLAACGVSKRQMKGLAAKIKKALESVSK